MNRFDVSQFGARGDGVQDDWFAIQQALQACAQSGGALIIPAGRYRITQPIRRSGLRVPISIQGDGSNVSVFLADSPSPIGGLDLSFDQDGWSQPWGLNMHGVGFCAAGWGGTAVNISYGQPAVTSDHFRPSVVLRDVVVSSDASGRWTNGIFIESAWNVSFSDVFVSGDSANGVWNNLGGVGIQLARMCVNAHFSNVRSCFWAVGFAHDAMGGPNTEGLFFSNCSMVGVKRGVWAQGNAARAEAPRMSTLTWHGGLVECRVSGVTGISAAFHFERVWTGLIGGCQILADAIPVDRYTYGVLLEQCNGVVVTGCDINAWSYGVHTAGPCRAVSSFGNTFTNVEKQNIFADGAVGCRTYGNTCVNNEPFDWAHDATVNRLGFS